MTVNDVSEMLQKDVAFSHLRHCIHICLESRRYAQKEYQPVGIEPATSWTRIEAIQLEQYDNLRKENKSDLLYYAETAQ